MCEMYAMIENLCQERGIKVGRLCADLGISRGVLSDLKNGRTKKLSAENLAKISGYFGISSDYLLGDVTKEVPAAAGGRRITDEEIRFALFGGKGEVTDAMYQEVKEFARFVLQREESKRKE